jgi:tetratricopeptide (TPR) repeat protein
MKHNKASAQGGEGRAKPRDRQALARRRSSAPGAQQPPAADRQSGRFGRQVIALSLIALIVRVTYVWQIRQSPYFDVLIGDARGYDAWAQQIAAGDWVGQGVFYQAPLYPYFLGTIYSIAGRDLFLARICQAMIGATGCALLALAGRRLQSERVGLFAGLGLAIYAPAIFFDGLLQKSVLDVFFISLVLWLLSGLLDNPGKRSRWFSLGLALGGLTLTRENGLVLIVPILLWRLLQPDVSWHSQTLRSTMVALTLGLVLVVLPVAVRNRAVGGEWHLTTSQFGPNFYLGNNPDADGTAGFLRQGRGAVEYERQDATELAQAAEGRNLTPREVSSYWTSRALAYMRANPWTWVKLEARKLRLLANAAELIDTESQDSYEEWSRVLSMAAVVGHFGILAPLTVLGVIAGWPDRRRLWLYCAMAATYGASVLLFFVSARYRLPLVPILMLIAAAGLSRLPTFVRAVNRARVAVTVAFIFLVAAFVNWPLWPPAVMRAATENNLGNALQDAQRFHDAEFHYKRAIEIQPDYAPAYVNLGAALLAQDRPEEAIDVYKRARSLTPDDVDLDTRMGLAFLRAGRPADAITPFQKALARGQTSTDLYLNMAAALIAVNRHEEAIPLFREALERHPTSSDLRFHFGTLLLEHNRFAEAIVELKAGLALSPETALAHGNLGAALAASGRTEEAIAEFEEALRLKPDLVSARRNLELIRK